MIGTENSRRDSFSLPVMSSSGSLYVASGSGHNSQRRTHTELFERDSRPLIPTQSAKNDRVESPFRDHNSSLQDLRRSNRGHVVFAPTVDVFLPQSTTGVYGSVLGLAGTVYVHDRSPCSAKSFRNCATQDGKTILLAPGGHHSRGSHLLRLCVDHSHIIPYRYNRVSSRTKSHTICTHGGSHAALPSSRIFRRGL